MSLAIMALVLFLFDTSITAHFQQLTAWVSLRVAIESGEGVQLFTVGDRLLSEAHQRADAGAH